MITRPSFRPFAVAAALCLLARPLTAQAPLTLDQAIGAALRREAIGARAALVTARGDAEARIARSVLLPSLTLRGAAMRQVINPAASGLPGLSARATDPFGTLDARAAIQVPLLDLPALARWRAARARTDARRAEAGRADEDAALAAAVAYVRVARAEALHQARVTDSLLAARLLRTTDERLAAGIVPTIDRTRAAGRLADARAAAITADGDLAGERLGLERATGIALGGAHTLATPLERLAADAAAPEEGEAIARALAARADLRALDAGLAAHAADLRAETRDWLPVASLVADAGTIGRGTDAMVGTWRVGVDIRSTVLDGWARPARRDAARAEGERLAIDRRERARLIVLEVREARLALATAGAQDAAARDRLSLAEAEVAQAEARFAAGLADNADLILALAGLERARTGHADALAARAAARLALDAAMGALVPTGDSR